MKKEKIILSFIAALIGIVMAIAAFFLYQSTKKVDPSDIKKINIESPTPTPSSSVFITIEKPKDEEVTDERIMTISGKTVPAAKIVILTESNEEAAVAASNGNFSTEITLDNGENLIEVSSIAKNGEIAKTKLTVTYSTETF